MKCAKCGKKIEHNSYKRISGWYYCLNCEPEKTIATTLEKTINVADIDFSELQKALVTPTEKAAEEIKKYGLVGFTEKPKRKRKVGKHKKKSTKKGRNTTVGYDTLYDDTVVEAIKEK